MSATIYQIKYGLERGTDDEKRSYKIRSVGMSDLSPDDITVDDFDALYDYAGHDDGATLDTIFARWNVGSGQESSAFRNAECRSLSTGDIIELDDGTLRLVGAFGFPRLETLEAEIEQGEN